MDIRVLPDTAKMPAPMRESGVEKARSPR